MLKGISFLGLIVLLVGLTALTVNVKASPDASIDSFRARVQACIQDSEDIQYSLEDMDRLVEFCMEFSTRQSNQISN